MTTTSSLGGGASSMTIMSTTTSSNHHGKSKSEMVNYLLLYEAMVRHQDLEYDATYDHIALTMGRIQYLGRPQQQHPPPFQKSAKNSIDDECTPKGMLTYRQMRRCLIRLGYTWNRSLMPPSDSSNYNNNNNNNNNFDNYYDDDVSVLSCNSSSTFVSGATSGNNTAMTTRDIIATDAQLIMLLTTLVEMEERDRALQLKTSMTVEKNMKSNVDRGEGDESKDSMFDRGLFLPEFVQAYKLIIGGMQSLQSYPNTPTATTSHEEYNLFLKTCTSLGISPGDKQTLQELKSRSRERTLGLLRLFGPNSNTVDNPDGEKHYDARAVVIPTTPTMQSAGESPTAQSSSAQRNNFNSPPFFDDGLQQSDTPNRATSSKKKRYGTPAMTAKDGLLPRLTEEEIRKMVHSKDTALARILEEHESEMNAMANNMEELRQRSLATARALKERRKRTRIAIVLCMLALVVGMLTYEYHRREQIKVQITSGREIQRQADLATIATLKENIAALHLKLSDAEATIRYEEGRYEEVKIKFQKMSHSLEEMEGRWLLDRRDLDHCRVTRKELDREMSNVKSRNVEVEEEVAWCRDRLQGTERALEGMERALKNKDLGSSLDGASQGLVVKTMMSSGEEHVSKTDKTKEKGIKQKPVQMEMKYNKSFRNAVILRQIYSAAVGMFVSALFPGIGRLVGLIMI